MILAKKLIPATFVDRPNRYLSRVLIENKLVEAFVPNPGRMKELLIAGVPVLLREAENPNRKTCYDLVAVNYNEDWVCIDSLIPNRFLYEFFQQQGFNEFKNYPVIKKEVQYKTSRFDFYLKKDPNQKKGAFIEAKSCTLIEKGIALFPDAPTQRGTRHVYELISALEEGYQAFVIIVIQSPKAYIFRPNKEMDIEFANAMTIAVQKGVKILAIATALVGNCIEFSHRVEVEL